MNLRDFRLEIFANRLPSKVNCTASGPNETSRERFFKHDFRFQTSDVFQSGPDIFLRLSDRIDCVSVFSRHPLTPRGAEQRRHLPRDPATAQARCRPVTLRHAPVIMSERGNRHTSAAPTGSAEVQRLQGISHFSRRMDFYNRIFKGSGIVNKARRPPSV